MSFITMATIEEDYVSFEIAKLLKEKGFEGFTLFSYSNRGSTMCGHWENEIDWLPKCTLQMAMKWLREKHNINIDIASVWNQKRFEYQVFIVTPKNAKHCYIDDKLYLCHEEACEAAIQYSLKNLI
jgi:hypothetical protein